MYIPQSMNYQFSVMNMGLYSIKNCGGMKQFAFSGKKCGLQIFSSSSDFVDFPTTPLKKKSKASPLNS